MLAHVVFSVSYVAIVVRARLSGFDRSLEEAALDLGARPVQTFWRVTLPLIAPGIVAGALLVLHDLDRRLRDHLLRRGRGRDDAAAPDLLDAQGRRDARGQRRLDAAARGDGRPHPHRPAPAAAAGGAGGDFLSAARALALLLLAAGAAAGCGPARDEPLYPGPGEKKLNVYIWSEYLPKEVIDEFTRRTGIVVHYDLYDSNEPVLEKLQSGVADYDLVVPSDYMVRILVHLKLLRPLDRARLKNFGNLDPRFLDKQFDPEERVLAALRLGNDGLRLQPGAGRTALRTAGRRSSTPRTRARS